MKKLVSFYYISYIFLCASITFNYVFISLSTSKVDFRITRISRIFDAQLSSESFELGPGILVSYSRVENVQAIIREADHIKLASPAYQNSFVAYL